MKTEDIMLRLGKSLDNQVIEEPWCRENEIYTGADYLWYWLTVSVRRPEWRLPVLVFDGPQDSGKSVFAKLLRAVAVGNGRMSHANQLLYHGKYFNGWVERYRYFVASENTEKYWLTETQNRFLTYVYSESLVVSKMGEADRIIKNNTRWVWEAGPDSVIPRTGAETIFTLEEVPVDSRIKREELIQLFESEIFDIHKIIDYARIRDFRSPLHMPVFRGDE